MFSFLILSDIQKHGDDSLFSKIERIFQQMDFHKATKVNLINVLKNNKGSISAVLIYYLDMRKCLLNFVHLKKS